MITCFKNPFSSNTFCGSALNNFFVGVCFVGYGWHQRRDPVRISDTKQHDHFNEWLRPRCHGVCRVQHRGARRERASCRQRHLGRASCRNSWEKRWVLTRMVLRTAVIKLIFIDRMSLRAKTPPQNQLFFLFFFLNKVPRYTDWLKHLGDISAIRRLNRWAYYLRNLLSFWNMHAIKLFYTWL